MFTIAVNSMDHIQIVHLTSQDELIVQTIRFSYTALKSVQQWSVRIFFLLTVQIYAIGQKQNSKSSTCLKIPGYFCIT